MTSPLDAMNAFDSFDLKKIALPSYRPILEQRTNELTQALATQATHVDALAAPILTNARAQHTNLTAQLAAHQAHLSEQCTASEAMLNKLIPLIQSAINANQGDVP